MGYSQAVSPTSRLLATWLSLFLVVGAILAVGRTFCPTCITGSYVLWPSATNQTATNAWSRIVITADVAQPTQGPEQHVSTSGPKPTWQELVEAVLQQGVPSDISAQLSAGFNSSAAGSCSALQQQASQAHACVRLESRQPLLVLLCMQPGNTQGTLLVYSLEPTGAVLAQPNAPKARGNIYRIRVSGPEILQLVVHYCGTVAAAGFSVTYPGTYHLEVLHLYQGFNYSAPPFVLTDMHAANHTFQAMPQNVSASAVAAIESHKQPPCELQGTAEAAAAAAAAAMTGQSQAQSPQGSPGPASHSSPGNTSTAPASSSSPGSSIAANSTDSCATCSGYNHKGRWVVAPGADVKLLSGLQQALQHTCAFQYDPRPDSCFGCPQSMLPAVVPDVEDHPLLEWLPYDCRYRKVTPAVVAQCKAALQQQPTQKRVCFIGDSQTRHLYNQVVHLIEGPSAGYRQQISGLERAYQVLQADNFFYEADNYGNWTARRHDTGSCSHVFINFGHWPLSFQEAEPWDVRQYAQQVAELAASMKQQQQKHGNRQFWMTLQPSPVVDYQQRRTGIKKGVDWRTDPFTMLFNKVASTVMQAHGIPTVDIYSIASPLFDMTYDASHYIGTVGLAQAEMLVNIVCSGLLQGPARKLA